MSQRRTVILVGAGHAHLYVAAHADTLIERGARARTLWEWTLLAVGLLATAGVMVYLTRLARSKLQEHMSGSAAEVEVASIAHDGDRGTGREAVPLRNTVILAVVALMMVGVATLAYVASGTMDHWLTGLAGL